MLVAAPIIDIVILKLDTSERNPIRSSYPTMPSILCCFAKKATDEEAEAAEKKEDAEVEDKKPEEEPAKEAPQEQPLETPKEEEGAASAAE